MILKLVTEALSRGQDKTLITAVVPLRATNQRQKKCTNFAQHCHFVRVLSLTKAEKPVQ